jgi:hypothetical protein
LERITVDIYDLIPQNNDFWVWSWVMEKWNDKTNRTAKGHVNWKIGIDMGNENLLSVDWEN